jgi:Terminase small subunit
MATARRLHAAAPVEQLDLSAKVPKVPKAANPATSNEYGLSEKQWRFCQEFIVDDNATAAYIRAGYKDTPSAEHNVSKIMGNDGVKKAIAALGGGKETGASGCGAP